MNTLIESNDIETGQRQAGMEETLLASKSPRGLHPEPAAAAAPVANAVQWSWGCRKLESLACAELDASPSSAPPAPGDLAVARVEKMGFHKHLTTAENRRLRIYPGVQFVGVFGNRYASDAYEAEVQGTGDLSLLTGAGMIGTVKSKYEAIADPTQISLIGFVRGADGRRLNLKSVLFRPTAQRRLPANLIYVIGTSMNSGKTTTGARLIRALSDLGLNVVACKLTGSVSNHDPDELAAASARKVIDFSDYGFASTYLSAKEELLDLFHMMMADAAALSPDVVLLEFADGILQRETTMLLREPIIQQAGRGVVLTASGSLSALWAASRLKELAYRIIAVSGKFTSSPLAMREYCENDSNIPVVSSAGSGVELATRVKRS